jgi:hypothetical protein
MATCILAACQTASPTASSVTEEAVLEARAVTLEKTCRTLAPTQISRAAYDGSPLEARRKMARDKAKWDCLCRNICVDERDWGG